MLVEHCGYSDLHDEMIRDRIVVGIRSSALSEKLQLDPRLTLDSAITQVCQAEAVTQQQPLLCGKPDTPVGAVKRGKGGPGRATAPTSHKQGQMCPRCGRHPAHDRAHCPARGQICNCGKRGGATSEWSVGHQQRLQDLRQLMTQVRMPSWVQSEETMMGTTPG